MSKEAEHVFLTGFSGHILAQVVHLARIPVQFDEPTAIGAEMIQIAIAPCFNSTLVIGPTGDISIQGERVIGDTCLKSSVDQFVAVAFDDVIASAALDHVVPRATRKCVVTRHAIDTVVARPT